jgi:hypothetical protein
MQLVAWNLSYATQYYRVNRVAYDFLESHISRFQIEHVPIDTTSRMIPFCSGQSESSKLGDLFMLDWWLSQISKYWPFPWYCSHRVLAIMIIHACSVAIQKTSDRVSMLKGKYFHFICITMVWNMILVLPCRQVSNMLQKSHATSFMQLVASCKQALIDPKIGQL